jgi:nucleotide-binding universal stress UspA family protein
MSHQLRASSTSFSPDRAGQPALTSWRRPLLATECGEFDSGAQGVALGLAQRLGVGLSAVFPLASNPEYEAVAPAVAARAEAQARHLADGLAARAAAAGVALTLDIRRSAERYEAILDACQQGAHDVLVMRRRGQRGFLANLLMGEMVSKVLAHAPCPVVMCPRDTLLWTRGVLVGVDPLSPLPGLVEQAAALARQAALPLHVVAVAADGTQRPLAEACVAAAVHQARGFGAQAQGEARTGRAHEALIAAAADAACDLIVLGRHSVQPVSRAWIGGVTQKVIGLAACPVWVAVEG